MPDASENLRAAALRLEIAADIHADAAAAALGLNRTDFSCLRILFAEGPATAGQLATTTGLTTGAVTGVLDRLEKQALVERRHDPHDRRKVLVLIPPEAREGLAPHFGGAWLVAPAGHHEAAALLEQLENRTANLATEAARLRSEAGRSGFEPGPGGAIEVPLAGARKGSFEVVGGRMQVAISAAAPKHQQLVSANLDDAALRLSERDGHVRLSHRAFLARKRPVAKVRLNPSLPWNLRVSGGSNQLHFDLAGLSTPDIEVVGGNGELRLEFGEVAAPVVLRVNGGASQLSLRRPPTVPVSVSVRGKLRLSVDGEEALQGGATRWASPGFETATDRIEVSVRGGLNSLSIETAVD